jgi:putative thioredoxin
MRAAPAELYAAVLSQDPENTAALAALAKLHVEIGDLEGAKRFLAMAPAAKANDAAIAGVRAAIELAEQAASLGDLADLQRRVETDPRDHQARFDLALGLSAKGRREEAVTHLLDIVRRDRSWNEDGARKQLVQFFEAWGPTDEGDQDRPPAAVLDPVRLGLSRRGGGVGSQGDARSGAGAAGRRRGAGGQPWA